MCTASYEAMLNNPELNTFQLQLRVTINVNSEVCTLYLHIRSFEKRTCFMMEHLASRRDSQKHSQPIHVDPPAAADC